jgi:EAL domain-containing protein (putative c-di-GMP-specific phosphodiesterase class I)
MLPKLCKTVINLAYNFARHVIAVSIEKLPMLALVSMGCDYGQGFLHGQPLPEERFISLLRQRAATRAAACPALNGKPKGVSLEPSQG